MGFPRQEYWSGLPFPSLEDLPDPGIELRSPALQADSLPSEPPEDNKVLAQSIITAITIFFRSYLFEYSYSVHGLPK